MEEKQDKYWEIIWRQYWSRYVGRVALFVAALFCFVAIYAPFFASSAPFAVRWNGVWYFPLFRTLFYSGFYTKKIDLFFNLMIFTFPAFLLVFCVLKKRMRLWGTLCVLGLQLGGFFFFASGLVRDPAVDQALSREKQDTIQERSQPQRLFSPLPTAVTWKGSLQQETSYAKLFLLLRHQQRERQHERLDAYRNEGEIWPTLWQWEEQNRAKNLVLKEKVVEQTQETYDRYLVPFQKRVALCAAFPETECTDKEQREKWYTIRAELTAHLTAQAQIQFVEDRERWLEKESTNIDVLWMPFVRDYHWEEDAGGQSSMNRSVPWWELTRINRRDLVASLIFGTRISLVVGIAAVSLALLIGIPVGALSGYYGGKVDIFVSRLLEIWESMPTFFMLLLIVAFTQTKSVFLVIVVIGLFGWTSFSRYTRGECLKQRNLPYIDACRALGFSDRRIVFSHILPNAIPPVLTLLPFAIMAAITTEAGLSFLGLGEEGSCSWGVLMDEGRKAFPAESYLLWPPAILLTTLLISIAIVGDTLRDAFDPKLRQ